MLKLLEKDLCWITRVPATVGAAKSLISSELEMTTVTDLSYALHATSLDFRDIPQKGGSCLVSGDAGAIGRNV